MCAGVAFFKRLSGLLAIGSLWLAQAAAATGLPLLAHLDEANLLRWLQQNQAALVDAGAAPTRVVFELGRLDPRLQLAPCQRVEPYVPPGTRMWGRSRLGLRCLEGAVHWDVGWPVQVQVWGRGWVVQTALPEGTLLQASQLGEAEIDRAAESSAALVDSSQWQGQVSARALTPGQVLRTALIRPPQWFAAGAWVRVRMQGVGFSASTDGQALEPGAQGRPVRVRLDNGRIVSALPFDARTVTVSP